MLRYALAFVLPATSLLACTVTPSDFPPCVNPDSPCVLGDGGVDGDSAAGDAEGGGPDAPPPDAPQAG